MLINTKKQKENRKMIFDKHKLTMITIVIESAIMLTAITSGLLISDISSQNLSSNGIIAIINVGAYTDSDCTINCTSIDWSTVAPGSLTNRTIYIKNFGTVPVTLSLANSIFNPSEAGLYMILTWDKEGATLAANSSTAAILTLNVSSSITGITAFSLNTVITGIHSS